MARRVILHVGTAKTGTTYLQTLMWNSRDVLRRQGVLFPGVERADHLNSSLAIRNNPELHRRGKRAPGAWNEMLREIAAFDGTAVISHEDLGLATAQQAQSALAALAPAEIHVVVTARDCVRALPALWQEHVKFHSVGTLADFGTGPNHNFWGWRSIDSAAILARWGSTLPPERVHVVTVPDAGAPRTLLWERFAGLIGVDPASCDASTTTSNDSLGVVEVELLRKVNGYLGREYSNAVTAGRWLRTYLAAQVLAPRGGDRYGPGPEQEALLRRRSVEIAEAIRDAGYDVIGDLTELLPPDGPSTWRHPDDVTSAELADAGAAALARVLDDLRKVTIERDRLRTRLARATAESKPPPTLLRRASRRVPALQRVVRRVKP